MRHATLALASILCLGATAEAAQITFTVAGTLDAITGKPVDPFAIGDPFTLRFAFNPDAPGVGDDDRRRFDASLRFPVRLEVDFPGIGGFGRDAIDPTGFIEVTRDRFTLFAGFLGFTLLNATGQAFDAATLPETLMGSQFTEGRFELENAAFGLAGPLQVDTIQRFVAPPVAEPSTLALAGIGLGLLGMGWARRRAAWPR